MICCMRNRHSGAAVEKEAQQCCNARNGAHSRPAMVRFSPRQANAVLPFILRPSVYTTGMSAARLQRPEPLRNGKQLNRKLAHGESLMVSFCMMSTICRSKRSISLPSHVGPIVCSMYNCCVCCARAPFSCPRNIDFLFQGRGNMVWHTPEPCGDHGNGSLAILAMQDNRHISREEKRSERLICTCEDSNYNSKQSHLCSHLQHYPLLMRRVPGVLVELPNLHVAAVRKLREKLRVHQQLGVVLYVLVEHEGPE